MQKTLNSVYTEQGLKTQRAAPHSRYIVFENAH